MTHCGPLADGRWDFQLRHHFIASSDCSNSMQNRAGLVIF